MCACVCARVCGCEVARARVRVLACECASACVCVFARARMLSAGILEHNLSTSAILLTKRSWLDRVGVLREVRILFR